MERLLRALRALAALVLLWPAAQATSPAADAPAGLPLDRIVATLTDRATFDLVPSRAAEHFASLARLVSDGPGKYLWLHEDPAPPQGLLWVRVEHQPGETAPWTLLQASIALPESDPARADIHAELRARLTRRLGKAGLSRVEDGVQMTVWSLGGPRRVVLRRGAIDSPYPRSPQRLVLVESVVSQGP